jgi:hypothetical protein
MVENPNKHNHSQREQQQLPLHYALQRGLPIKRNRKRDPTNVLVRPSPVKTLMVGYPPPTSANCQRDQKDKKTDRWETSLSVCTTIGGLSTCTNLVE